MSFRRAQARSQSDDAIELFNRLLAEFESPNIDPKAQPIIHAEPAEPAPISRLFVIWDDWEDLSHQERSELIMDAYKKYAGLQAAVKVSIAMGLTTQEAVKLGLV